MMLVEEGRIGLDEPLATYVPAFADARVWDGGALRAPTRAITIRDLLRHTSGLTYGIFGDSPVDRMYLEALGGLSPHSGRTVEETVDIIASLPLLDSVRLLRAGTVREMTRNQLGDLGTISLAPTDGFGLGFAVSVTGPTSGIHWWVGVVNTWFWIDPVERIVALAWTQLDPLGAGQINPTMRRLVYDAVVDSRRGVPAGAPRAPAAPARRSGSPLRGPASVPRRTRWRPKPR